MAIESFDELLQQLDAHPEWRVRLQRVVLTDRLLALPDSFAELAQAELRTEARLGELAQAQQRTEARLDELAQAQVRTEARLDELAQAQVRTEARLDELAQAQVRTEARLEQVAQGLQALTEQVSVMATRLDGVVGWVTERRYVEKAAAYFGRIASRIHVLTDAELNDLLEDAVTSGALSAALAHELRLADAVIRGRRDGVDVLLVLEASSVIDSEDVRRARERAELLARTGRVTLPIVACGRITRDAARDARTGGVWQVTDGRTEEPDAA